LYNGLKNKNGYFKSGSLIATTEAEQRKLPDNFCHSALDAESRCLAPNFTLPVTKDRGNAREDVSFLRRQESIYHLVPSLWGFLRVQTNAKFPNQPTEAERRESPDKFEDRPVASQHWRRLAGGFGRLFRNRFKSTGLFCITD